MTRSGGWAESSRIIPGLKWAIGRFRWERSSPQSRNVRIPGVDGTGHRRFRLEAALSPVSNPILGEGCNTYRVPGWYVGQMVGDLADHGPSHPPPSRQQ